MTAAGPDLVALAEACGVSTTYVDGLDRPVTIDAATVRAVLGLLGVDATDPAGALRDAREAPWRRPLPPSAVVRRSAPGMIVARLPAGVVPVAELELETGGRVAVPSGPPEGTATVDGRDLVAVPLLLPGGLPLGDHTLHLHAGPVTAQVPVIVVPDQMPTPLAAGGQDSRAWGWMVQLYAVRSAGSWGMGDYTDLGQLAGWSGSADGQRADVLLVNPLHAGSPTFPVATSPYFPASRRFASPLYLRPSDLPEYARADDATRARVDALAAGAGGDSALIDRDEVWRAKLAALELLFEVHQRSGASVQAADAAVEDFATWSALAERHGGDWRTWPADLRDPRGPAVAAARADLAGRIAFHVWLQQACDTALAAAQAAATGAGMTVGIVHDLAVGVDPGGADAWALQDVFAVGATVGAPPDNFNQQGQDWGLPPWRPDRLAETGYDAFRQMLRAVLRRGGGVRIDHILGLFRLWWIPGGSGPADGAYVRYDADAMLGVLALEATRAGALVVGEDLGTVEPWVRDRLAACGVLGSSVLWFERTPDGAALPPARWRRHSMASVTTHDLPTAAGFLTGEHVRLRIRLGLLGRPEAEEIAAWRQERAGLLGLLADAGRLPVGVPPGWLEPGGPDDASDVDPAVLADLTAGLHALLVDSASAIVLAAPGDAVGDLRQPNLPGTVDAYPNWCLPVTDASGRPVDLDQFPSDPRVLRLACLLRGVATSPVGGIGGLPGGPAVRP